MLTLAEVKVRLLVKVSAGSTTIAGALTGVLKIVPEPVKVTWANDR